MKNINNSIIKQTFFIYNQNFPNYISQTVISGDNSMHHFFIKILDDMRVESIWDIGKVLPVAQDKLEISNLDILIDLILELKESFKVSLNEFSFYDYELQFVEGDEDTIDGVQFRLCTALIEETIRTDYPNRGYILP